MKWLALPIVLLLVFARDAQAQSIDSHSFWQNFRKTSPFPTQDIVVSPITSAGDVTLILSEPPPEVWKHRDEVLRNAFPNPGEIISTKVETYPVGFDGWVKDIVMTLRGVSARDIDAGVRSLNEAYYGTSYGASYRVVEPHSWDAFAAAGRHTGPPNLKISAASLHDWLMDGKTSLVDRSQLDDMVFSDAKAPRFNLSSVFDSVRKGVFYTEPAGLVLLALNRDQPMNESRALLRQFTLDSDALLGAVTRDNSSSLVLVGRIRSTSVSDMPPLRVDTILTLAATSKKDLAQSYERSAPLAGPISDPELEGFIEPSLKAEGGLKVMDGATHPLKFPLAYAVDWAPILLSRELTNTEFGQLLDITDQMLKGWSEGNLVAYGNFPYPAPRVFPEPLGVFTHLKSQLGDDFSSLTYNWNTSGYGSWTKFGAYDIFAVLNTNALPVSYIPEGSEAGLDDRSRSAVRAAEDEFGAYYPLLRDPSLGRVAEYAALHVIFTRFRMTATRTEPLANEDQYNQRWSRYKGVVSAAIRRLDPAQAPKATLEDEPDSCLDRRAVPGEEEGKIVSHYVQDDGKLNHLVDVLVDGNQFSQQRQDAFDRYQDDVDVYYRRDKALRAQEDRCLFMPGDHLCTSLSSERQSLDHEQERLLASQIELASQAAELHSLLWDGQTLSPLLPNVGDCGAAWRGVRDTAISQEDSVFKTPSIVVSTHIQAKGRGGHNLFGRSVEIVQDNGVNPGSISIDQSANVIRINPADASQSTSIAREFERNRLAYVDGDATAKSNIEEQVGAVIKTGPPEQQFLTDETLGLTDSPGRTALGGSTDRRTIGPLFGRLPAAELNDAVSLANATSANLVVTSRNGFYSLVDPGPPPLGIQIQSPFDMLRAIEERVARAARTADATDPDHGFIVVSDGSLSLGDMDGIRISAQTRQMIAQAAGGGDMGLPPDGRVGFFFERDPERLPKMGDPNNDPKSAGAGSGGPSDGGPTDTAPPRPPGPGGRDWLAAFPFNREVRATLTRTDADWRAASLSLKPATLEAGTQTIIQVLEIPMKHAPAVVKAEPFLIVTLKAFFGKRLATEGDTEILNNVVKEQLMTRTDGIAIGAKLISIRNSFNDRMKGDASLRSYLRQNNLDFNVVEIVTHGTQKTRG